MCAQMPPALVEGAEHLIEYWVDGSDRVDGGLLKGYTERFINGELYKRFPSIQCLVHSHAEAVIPYAVVDEVPLLPVYHMGGFLGRPVPVWDPALLYNDSDRQDMRVNTERLGASLAEAFGPLQEGVPMEPEWNVVLIKRHGCTMFGKDIATACYRAIYTLVNAGIQTNATLLRAASKGAGAGDVMVQGLSQRHAQDCQIMTEATQFKSWDLWKREVEASPPYKNSV